MVHQLCMLTVEAVNCHWSYCAWAFMVYAMKQNVMNIIKIPYL